MGKRRKSHLEVCRNEEGAGTASVVIRESVNRGMVQPVRCLQVCQEQKYAENITTLVSDSANSDAHNSATPNCQPDNNGNVK